MTINHATKLEKNRRRNTIEQLPDGTYNCCGQIYNTLKELWRAKSTIEYRTFRCRVKKGKLSLGQALTLAPHTTSFPYYTEDLILTLWLTKLYTLHELSVITNLSRSVIHRIIYKTHVVKRRKQK